MSTSELMPPDSDLLESMRAVGYSVDTAIADLIDNSLSAGAKSIQIGFESEGEAFLSIFDDGSGMDQASLRTAMRLAGKPPSVHRNKTDLGRFGLGLKTASFSQAKRLTVASKILGGSIVSAIWDLDEVRESKSWKLEWLGSEEIELLPDISKLKESKSGTLVIWQKLDTLLADFDNDPSALASLIGRAAEHLSLVFHRFIDGSPSDRVAIWVNEKRLQAIDPFFTKNTGTQIKPETKITVGQSEVTVTPYILPHMSQMNREERSESDFLKQRFRDTQGFYIYRQKRLISFGSWFKLTPRSELSKLARVRVDTPNTLDREWKLGVMKSSIQPPEELRKKLAHLVPSIISDSKRVVTRKGAVASNVNAVLAWQFREIEKHRFNLEIAKDHPVIVALDEVLDDEQRGLLEKVFDQLEVSLPVVELAQRINGDKVHGSKLETNEELIVRARGLYHSIHSLFSDTESAFNAVLMMEPFVSDPFKHELARENRSEIVKQDTPEAGAK
jgi:hypothetical protein